MNIIKIIKKEPISPIENIESVTLELNHDEFRLLLALIGNSSKTNILDALKNSVPSRKLGDDRLSSIAQKVYDIYNQLHGVLNDTSNL